MKYVIGIGTNMGNRLENLKNAVYALELAPKTAVIKKSAVYETSPVGYAKQQDFYNCAVLCESAFEPHEMLGICLGVECGLGRVRNFKNGPRVIDMDLLLAEDKIIRTPNLIVPHPHIKERLFVLLPMLDLFESGVAFGFDFAGAIGGIKDQQIKKTKYTLDE
ncbi:2-amino-4-hydroxy-6-hydroxymethyldihydropteridinediphosphokinase [Clostridium sp. CAG:678]|uniref:2-amino-4-hydroxy-6-hydroxymethyldihydropteridine diphosphokinase n=1 Tax=Candidatus Eubacterium faecale TaxID=2838568 RepID=A0A9D2S9T3_9FIRM|nr:2-amino-4-hydroxy-6-hydroxymethyldihydropteridinediphosphokinase [Clostridium sp. CAG:678]HJB74790.1 2-amino-4-hydroxy-6-hydroxymethyldihydropteridine diphosphokinase [Candidatus Eubacterium faecale]